jgi:hypothetical protein
VCHSTTVFEADEHGLVTKAVTVADSDDKKASASADVAYVYNVAVKPIFEAAWAAGTMPPMVDRAGMAGAFEHVPLELAQNAGAATVAAVTRTRHAWVSTLLARHLGFEGKPLASLVRCFFREAVWAGGAGARKKKEDVNKKEEKKRRRRWRRAHWRRSRSVARARRCCQSASGVDPNSADPRARGWTPTWSWRWTLRPRTRRAGRRRLYQLGHAGRP